jgi:hypothetical protein
LLEVECGLLSVDSLPVPTKNMSEGQTLGHVSRGQEAQEGMHGEALAGGPEVRGGAERVSEDEHAPLCPPERCFAPARHVHDAEEPEGSAFDVLSWYDVMRHAETSRELRAVAVVAVEELDHSRRPAGSADPLFDPVHLERIDEPDAALHDERVRCPLQEPLFPSPEPVGELVADAKVHLRSHGTETRI